MMDLDIFILEKLKKAGVLGLNRTSLYVGCRHRLALGSRQLDGVLDTLESEGRIVKGVLQGGKSILYTLYPPSAEFLSICGLREEGIVQCPHCMGSGRIHLSESEDTRKGEGIELKKVLVEKEEELTDGILKSLLKSQEVEG